MVPFTDPTDVVLVCLDEAEPVVVAVVVALDVVEFELEVELELAQALFSRQEN